MTLYQNKTTSKRYDPLRRHEHPLCLEHVCKQPSLWQWITVFVSNGSMLLKSLLPNEIWSSTVTSPPSVWQSTSLPPACCRPCTHKPRSQTAPDQPGPESRSRLHVAPWSLWTIGTPASRSEATSPSAVGSLGLKRQDITESRTWSNDQIYIKCSTMFHNSSKDKWLFYVERSSPTFWKICSVAFFLRISGEDLEHLNRVCNLHAVWQEKKTKTKNWVNR